jgi:hypothetical protein
MGNNRPIMRPDVNTTVLVSLELSRMTINMIRINTPQEQGREHYSNVNDSERLCFQLEQSMHTCMDVSPSRTSNLVWWIDSRGNTAYVHLRTCQLRQDLMAEKQRLYGSSHWHGSRELRCYVARRPLSVSEVASRSFSQEFGNRDSP